MISANIITLNEEKNIGECIVSLTEVCNEVVVVDSGSSDRTVEIAESKGARVIVQPYLGDGYQKNVALDHVKNEWVLSIDADERLTEDMAAAIKEIDLLETPHDAFSFRRRNMIGSRWIQCCGWYPDYCVRLYNKNKARFKEVAQHSSVVATKVRLIEADIVHYSFANIGQLFAKPGRDFSGRAAKIMYKEGRRANGVSPFLHGFSAFAKKYLLQKGFLGGVDGMTVSLSSGLNSYLKYARLLEYQRDSKVLNEEDFGKIW